MDTHDINHITPDILNDHPELLTHLRGFDPECELV